MPIAVDTVLYTCPRCTRALRNTAAALSVSRAFSTSPLHRDNGNASAAVEEKKRSGALSARLEQMTEEALETGGSGARKAVEEAGFNEDLKRRLEERIKNASFRSTHASAFAQAELPSSAGRGTRDIAAAQAWTGEEALGDAALRMLDDASKPMKMPMKIPSPRGPPVRMDTGKSRNRVSSGSRLENARDRTSIYTTMKDVGMSEEERRQYKEELKARFAPTARSLPATLQGLASLANERIENAIARGQFKNLPRGKGKHVERDHNANSPFLDTTEYFMNKIIQRQDIVPPWIEKQQELISTATKLRGRLRHDWKRHAARMIASSGGSLETQIRRAQAYAAAEAIFNPSGKKVEKLDTVDSKGHMSQITLTGTLKALPQASSSDNIETHIEVRESPVSSDANSSAVTGEINISQDSSTPQASENSPIPPATHPYRDPTWEANERKYLELAIANLNSIARTYNLMAPPSAQKPYYNLEREMKSCFAEVAPLIPEEILERATRPKGKVEVITHRPGSILEQTFHAQKARVYDENLQVKGYGFKQFWQDVWGGGNGKNGV